MTGTGEVTATVRFEVARVSDFPPGTRRIVSPRPGSSIGVFNVGGRYYALKNTCPHMGGPLCEGLLTGTTRAELTRDGRYTTEWIRDNEVVTCPWHHWEFDIVTGRTIFPSRQRVATYEVTVDEPAADPPPGETDAGRREARVETYPVVVEDARVYLELR